MPSHGSGGVTSPRLQVENKSPHDRKIARGFFVSGRRGGERTSAFSYTVAAAESVRAARRGAYCGGPPKNQSLFATLRPSPHFPSCANSATLRSTPPA